MAHEERDLNRLDVGARRDQVHRHHGAWVIAAARCGEDLLADRAGGAVDGLLAKALTLSELSPQPTEVAPAVRAEDLLERG